MDAHPAASVDTVRQARSSRLAERDNRIMASRYVDSTEQLVTEIVVREISRSTEFYRGLGFELLRDGGDFVELTWEQHRLFLAERSAFRGAESIPLGDPPPFPHANV